MAVELFDTHAHLDDPRFDADRDEVVARANETGVVAIVTIGTTAQTSRKCVAIAGEYSIVYAAVGIQPNYVAESQTDDWQRIETLVDRPKVVAIGETGLDRHWDFTPFDQQMEYFSRHLRLSRSTGLPVVIHCREAERDVVAMLREQYDQEGPIHGVMHSFSGDLATAEACLQMGLYISFAGMVSYKKSQPLREVAAAVPRDRLLAETDSPYLPPQPVRGKRNEPAFIRYTLECLAEARNEPLEGLAAATAANARRLFAIDASPG